MSQASGVLPALRSITSLPPEFKVTGNLAPHLMEKHGDVKVRSTDVIGSGSPENVVGEVSGEVVQDRAGDADLFEEDLAYSEKGVSLGDRPSIADEDLVLQSVPLPFLPISISSREHRWSDTTPYASKKVLLASDFNLILC